MTQSMLGRAILVLEAGRPVPEAVRDYLLEILGKRRRFTVKPRKAAKWEAALLPVPKLKKELDRAFSIFIRTRDASVLDPDMGICRTCRSVRPWREMDCGHYQPRQDLNTRWDERNCHLQCKSCNGFRGGEAEKMAAYIDGKYGKGTAEILQAKARIPLKLDRHKLTLWVADYKRKIGEA